MNYLAKFDESMVIGYLKAGGTTDSDVLHSRQETLVSSLEIGRKLAFLPMAFGGLWVIAGIPLLLVLVGFIVIPVGAALIYVSVWARKRMAANIAVTQSAYANYMSTLPPRVMAPPRLAAA